MSYGVKLDPHPIAPGLSVRDLVDNHLYAYNAARLREACQLFARKIAEPDVTIGVTLSGALTPTGLGTSAIVPLIRAGPSIPGPIASLALAVPVKPISRRASAWTVSSDMRSRLASTDDSAAGRRRSQGPGAVRSAGAGPTIAT